MRARVKAESQYPNVRSAGMIWVKVEWLPVPTWAEREISACPYLEIQTLTEVTDTPQTVEDKAAKMVITQPGSRKGKRKL